MDKESLWKLYVSKNPLLPNAEWARRMFDTTYDAAHKEGFKNGMVAARDHGDSGRFPDFLKSVFRQG